MPTAHKQPGIAIVGFPRSGTTLLRRLLDAHPQIDAPGETYLLSSCARFLETRRVVDGVQVGALSGVSMLGVEEQEILGRLRRLVTEIRGARAAMIGKRRWVEKTAIDAFHLDAIAKVFGDELQFVAMIRHGADVCMSTQEWCAQAESYPRELHRYVQQYLQPLVAFAHAWVDSIASLERFRERRGDAVHLVRYEELVTEPTSVLRELFEFLGESWDDEIVARGLDPQKIDGFGDWKAYERVSIDANSVGRWRTLSQGTLRQLGEILNPTLERLGYEPLNTSGSDDPAETLRRYQLGLLARSAMAAKKRDE